jgi:hypothetical protein
MMGKASAATSWELFGLTRILGDRVLCGRAVFFQQPYAEN